MNRLFTRFAGLIAGCAMVFAATSARAQAPARDANTVQQMQAGADSQMDAQARARFRVGQSLYETGRFQEAAVEFAAAYDLSQRSQLLFNLYVAHRDAGDIEAAIDALGRYLSAMPTDLEGRVNLEARLQNMQATLEAQRQQAAAQAAAAAAQQQNDNSAQTAPRTTHRSPVGLVVAGVGAAMMITGAATGVLALGKVTDLEEMCPNNMCPASAQSTRDSASTLVTITDVLLFGGGAVVVGGLALWLFGPEVEDEAAPAVTGSAFCMPGTCTVSVQGQF